MRLKEIFGDVPDAGVKGSWDTEISGITNDSRKVTKGGLFFAITGQKTDGSVFIRQALENGAAAVASASSATADLAAAFPDTAWITVPRVLEAFSKASSAFYAHPSRRFTLIGVTGTKGKTTATFILESIYTLFGANPGVIGTIDHRVGGKAISKAANTTPMAHDLHSLFRTMADAGSAAVIMEVSSHALALERADEAAFDVAVFTNLQRDHLDFHKDRENYFKAKQKIFQLLSDSPKRHKSAVVNADDEKAGEILSSLGGTITPVTYGIDKPADFRAGKVEILQDRTIFELAARGTVRQVTLRLLGRFNIYNALAAIAAAVSAGVPLETAVKGAEALANVPGRLEQVSLGQPFTVFVDYAHTDAALENVLSNLAKMPHGRIITVFGCGGDRDRTKRAPMGRAAASMSDHAIVTSDNPRTEDPARIFSDIEAGLKGSYSNYELIPDRRTAIGRAVELARAGDIVLIAGKGHEDYQILKDRTIHFDDREAAAEAIREKMKVGRLEGYNPLER